MRGLSRSGLPKSTCRGMSSTIPLPITPSRRRLTGLPITPAAGLLSTPSRRGTAGLAITPGRGGSGALADCDSWTAWTVTRRRSSTWARSRTTSRALARHVGGAQVMAVVKADGYGHGMIPAAAAALDGGATWLGVVHVAEALALRRGGADRAGAVPARRAGRAARGGHPPRRRPVRGLGRAGRPDRRGGGAGGPAGPAAPQGRHRDVAGRRDRRGLARRGGGGAGRRGSRAGPASSGSCRISPAPTSRAIRRSRPSSTRSAPRWRSRSGRGPAAGAAPGQHAGHADPAGSPVRPGPARRGRVRAVHAARRRPGLAAPGDDHAGPAGPGQAGPGRPGRVLRAPLHHQRRGHARPGAARVRRGDSPARHEHRAGAGRGRSGGRSPARSA